MSAGKEARVAAIMGHIKSGAIYIPRNPSFEELTNTPMEPFTMDDAMRNLKRYSFLRAERDKPRCFITSSTGNCPETPAWGVNVNDKEIFLCEQCYKNVASGAYGPRVKVLAAARIADFIPTTTR